MHMIGSERIEEAMLGVFFCTNRDAAIMARDRAAVRTTQDERSQLWLIFAYRALTKSLAVKQ